MNDEANNKRIKRILRRPLLPACFSTLCKWKTTTKWSTTTTFNWWKVTTWSILTTKLIRLLRSRDYFTLRPRTGCLRQRTVTMMDSFVRDPGMDGLLSLLCEDFKWNFAAFCWPKGIGWLVVYSFFTKKLRLQDYKKAIGLVDNIFLGFDQFFNENLATLLTTSHLHEKSLYVHHRCYSMWSNIKTKISRDKTHQKEFRFTIKNAEKIDHSWND